MITASVIGKGRQRFPQRAVATVQVAREACVHIIVVVAEAEVRAVRPHTDTDTVVVVVMSRGEATSESAGARGAVV